MHGLTRLTAHAASALLAVACGAVPSQAVPTPFPTSPTVGVVIAVDSSGLADVRGFTLRPSEGGGLSFGFKLGPLENATEFSPSHLAEHMASSEPIRVYFRTENGEHLVYRLEDAATPATPT